MRRLKTFFLGSVQAAPECYRFWHSAAKSLPSPPGPTGISMSAPNNKWLNLKGFFPQIRTSFLTHKRKGNRSSNPAGISQNIFLFP